MYSVSNGYLSAVTNTSRDMTMRITLVDFSTVIGTDKISRIEYTENVNAGNVLTMGSACSHQLKATIFNPPSGTIFENAKIFVENGIKVSGSYEYVPFGYFWITKAEYSNNGKVLDITAYDSMCKLDGKYVPTVSSNTTLQAVYDDLKTQLATMNITLKSRTCPSYSLTSFPSLDITYQQAIGYVAGCLGGFARFDRDGNLEIAWYTNCGQDISKDLQYLDGLDEKTTKKKITALVTGTKDKVITKGNGTLGITLNFENPYITDAMATAIFNDVENDEFYPCQLKWIGNPAIMAGDGVDYYNNSNTSCYTYITNQTFTYDGGLVCDIECVAESTTEVVFTGEYSTVPRKISSLQRAIEDATRLITGNQGGYVVMHDSDGDGQPDEILVMDTPSINTAIKVWRWNKQGLGYSSTGYSGTYDTAITSNGEIVADFITAGTLQGIEIIANTGSIGGWTIENDGISRSDPSSSSSRYAIKLITQDGNVDPKTKIIGYKLSDSSRTFEITSSGYIGVKYANFYALNTGHKVTKDYTTSDIGKVLGVISDGNGDATVDWVNGGGGGSGDMQNPMTTVGDMIVGGTVVGGKATPTRLGIGNEGECLTSINGTPTWSTPCHYQFLSINGDAVWTYSTAYGVYATTVTFSGFTINHFKYTLTPSTFYNIRKVENYGIFAIASNNSITFYAYADPTGQIITYYLNWWD